MLDDKLATLIQTHLQRYPEMDLLDVYKMLHQSVFGPGHAIKNQKVAREWLDRECGLLQPKRGLLLVENVHPDGEIVRIHLRPYLAEGGSLGKLLDGFVQSSKTVHGELHTMAHLWDAFLQMIQPGERFSKQFDERIALLIRQTQHNADWPANHHSPVFDRTYKPAYRVLTLAQAQHVLDQQGIEFTPA
jgi:hypothetical protein